VRPAALLLDLDGTLVDSEPIHRRGYADFFAARGCSVPDLSVFTGRRAEDVFATEPGPWTGHDPLALLAEVLTFIPNDPAEPVSGAIDLMSAARSSGVALAIVTSAGPAWVTRCLAVLGCSVDVVVTAEDVADGKPDPAGFALACLRLDVSADATWAVEDSPAGVRSALGAGVARVHGVATTHDPGVLRAAGAHAVHRDLTPLVAQLASA
jgi:HAD superfamily hydrolase (TIGR01509 family)